MKNIHPLQAAKRESRRLAKLRAKPSEQPVCLICGCAEPMLLRPITKEFFEKYRRVFEDHHVFGRKLDPETTLALCLNHHALITEGFLRAGIEMKSETDLVKFAEAIFRAQSVHLRMLSDASWKFADRLRNDSDSSEDQQ